MDRYLALFLLIVAVTSAIELENTQYLITTPYQYYPGQDETLGVQIFGSKSCDVKVTLKSRDGYDLVTSANGTFAPGERGNLKLSIPANAVRNRPHYYRQYFKLQANVCGQNSDTVNVMITRRNFDNIVFIQTDKPIYKPGQKIRMRIIVLDRKLRPKVAKIDSVRVTVSSSRISQWDNVELQDGFASLELQLSKEPVLGQYDIMAIVGKKRTTQRIEVSKYVLPKYEVSVKLPEYMALDQKEFTTTVCAKYTYGKNVKGTLNAELCLKHTDYRYMRRIREDISFTRCENITKEIDGCTDITLLREALNVGEITNLYGTLFIVKSQVTETLTGVTLKKTAAAKGNFKTRSVQMSFDGTSNKFKPGLPFSYVLKVTRPDDSPATGAKVRVTVARGWYSGALFYNRTFIVTNGFITDSINDATYNAKSLVFEAELLDKNPYPVKVRNYYYNRNLKTSFTANPWYSPSFSYLEILKKKTPAMIGSEASLTVRYTARNDTGEKVDFYYTVMCKGKFVKTGKHTQHHEYIPVEEQTATASTTTASITTTAAPTSSTNTNDTNANVNGTRVLIVKYLGEITPPWRRRWTPSPDPVKKLHSRPLVKKFDIEFPVTMEMVPSCRVMVYYVRKDKEVVADSVELDVEARLENQVSVSFADGEKKPGEKTNLVLKASPGSRVAFVAVDKSIHILKSGNELTKDKIRPYLSEYRSSPWSSNPKCDHWRHWGRRKRGIIMPWWGDSTDYEDASKAFDIAGLVFLSNLRIFTKPCPKFYLEDFVMDESESVPQTGGVVGPPGQRGDERPRNVENNKRKPSKPKQKPVKIRKEFPETWLWSDEKLDASGNKTIEVTVPDTITSWVANGFAISSKTGIGVSDTTTLKAFQPFFVSMTLPYSVIRGEEIPIIVTVFNYLPSCVAIKLQLSNKQADYKVTSYHINKLCVCGSEGKSVKFTIIPTNLGHIPLTVTATTSSARLCSNSTSFAQDAVTRKLLVEPEGIRKEFTQGTFFCPGNREHKEVFDLRVPANYVPGSVYPTVTIIGDIMGPAMTNLEDLLRMPYGCGEQNMANFAPNIYIMDYLTKTNQVTAGIKSMAENFMKVGYQRELTYKRKSGSYSAFGDSDSQGSMMLTAFVVRSFARAKRYIYVDDSQVKHSFRWFHSKQLDNGCFPQYGKVFNRGLQGGVNSELTITAYVTTALLEAGQTTNTTMVSRALSCITSRLDTITDTYSTALVTYTLTLANHTDALRMLRILKNKAIKEEGQMYWANGNKPAETPRNRGFYYRSSADVEMTAYALLAILHQTPKDEGVVTNEIMDIIRWLSRQRNSRGGFSSTQDTCVALQGLAEFAGRAYGDSADFNSSQLTGSLKMGNHYNHNFVVTQANKLTLQTVELPHKIIPGKLEVTGQGVGCALLQASVKYNIPEPEDVQVFDIKVDVRTRRSAPDEETTQCSPLKLEITTKWLKEDVSNMAVVDIKLVTGFSVREESLENLRNDPAINFKRYDIDGQNVQLYFDEIKDITFSIDIHQDTLVKKLKPAVVKVYDYYEPESQAKVMYRIGETECYGNRVGAECPRCVNLENLNDVIQATVECNSTVTRMKSARGMLRVVKAFSDDSKSKRIMKKNLEYRIPEFCPCEEIYEKERSIVIGRNSYFQDDGRKVTIVLNSGTTIFKYTGKSMKPQIRKIKKHLDACKRKAKRRN